MVFSGSATAFEAIHFSCSNPGKLIKKTTFEYGSKHTIGNSLRETGKQECLALLRTINSSTNNMRSNNTHMSLTSIQSVLR